MVLLEQNITKKGLVNNNCVITQLERDISNSKEYKVETICQSEVYIKKFDNSYLSGFYYFFSCKSSLEEKNTLEQTIAIQ